MVFSSVIEHPAQDCSERQARNVARKAADRRVQRTEQLLRAALMSLIQEKGFEALSVQDIIDRANVGRATFYAHFENKEDLLASGIHDYLLKPLSPSQLRDSLVQAQAVFSAPKATDGAVKQHISTAVIGSGVFHP